jgi:hypothetical protein
VCPSVDDLVPAIHDGNSNKKFSPLAYLVQII